jgi:hypothetical protein
MDSRYGLLFVDLTELNPVGGGDYCVAATDLVLSI